MQPFYEWLEQQQLRSDLIGDYARQAVRNTLYPRSSRLYILLKYERNAERHGAIKAAHKEWRSAK